MLWNNWIAAFFLCCIYCASVTAETQVVCPIRPSHPLRYVDVFDGEPAELATLVPGLAKESYGYWLLGYVYDAGRFVTIRCKYADKQTLDVKLANRINRCDYKLSSKKALKIDCQ